MACPADLKPVLDRALAGDASALPALKAAFDRHPELVAHFGDLARHAELALLDVAAGTTRWAGRRSPATWPACGPTWV